MNAPTPMSRDRQELLVKASEAIIREVRDTGRHPDEALRKVGSAMNLLPQEIRRVAEAYNVSRSLHHFAKTAGEARTRPFALCDGQAVAEEMFPASVKSASVSPASLARSAIVGYRGPSRLEKAAAAIKLPPMEGWHSSQRQAMAKSASAKPQRAPLDLSKAPAHVLPTPELHKAAALAESRMDAHRTRLGQRAELCKAAAAMVEDNLRIACHGVGYARVEAAIRTRYPDQGETLSDLLYKSAGLDGLGHARAKPRDLRAPAIADWASEPYASISKLAGEMAELDAESRRLRLFTTLEKAALFDATRGVISGLASGLTGASRDPALAKATQKAYEDVQDPDHRDQIARIQAKAMLHDLLSNDEIISKYEPQVVLDRYNELAQLDPELVRQPAMVRGALRRTLQTGAVDPFEVSQYVNTAKGLHDASKSYQEGEQALTQDASQTYELPDKPKAAPGPAGIASRFSETFASQPRDGSITRALGGVGAAAKKLGQGFASGAKAKGEDVGDAVRNDK